MIRRRKIRTKKKTIKIKKKTRKRMTNQAQNPNQKLPSIHPKKVKKMQTSSKQQ